MEFDLEKMDQNDLKRIILKLLDKIKSSDLSFDVTNQKFFVLLPKNIDGKCHILFELLREKNKYLYDAIIPDEMGGDEIQTIVKSSVFKNIHKLSFILESGVNIEHLLIAVMPRNNVIRLAQCLCEDEIDLLIKRQFEAGHAVWLYAKGIEKLSNKEPGKYAQKVLGYYKELFEYGIKLFDA